MIAAVLTRPDTFLNKVRGSASNTYRNNGDNLHYSQQTMN